jgi:hypothetical protein
VEKATGDVRKLLRVLEEIQILAGEAKAAYENDRDSERYYHVVEPLEKIFGLCVEERGRFDR